MIGAYGTIIPIQLSISEIPHMVDISFAYQETRSFDTLNNITFKPLEPSVLTPASREPREGDIDKVVEGMYNLQLPLSEFNKKGFYTVYIKPKEIKAVIADVGNLTAFPNIRGMVIDISQIEDEYMQVIARQNNGLVGYRVVYMDDNGARENYYRIITSSNRCEPVIQAPNSSHDKSYSYRYEEASNFIFVTLTPSSAPSFKNDVIPYIGKPTQRILLVNTLFEPIQLDIEMTTHDADTISYMLENDQLRDLDNGLVTTFNDNAEIYLQNEHYTLKNQTTGAPVYEVRKNRRNTIDFSQTINDK